MNTKGIFNKNNALNALVNHRNESDHNFNLKINATLIKKRIIYLKRKCIECALIAISSSLILRPGFYNTSLFLADLLLSQCGIFNNKRDKNKHSLKKLDVFI